MNPGLHELLQWLDGLGVTVLDERIEDASPSADLLDRASAPGFSERLARSLGLSADDPRLQTLLDEARKTGSAMLEVPGHRIAATRLPDRALRVAVLRHDRRTAGVVHELANALTGIAGWARLVATSGPLPEPARAGIDTLERTAGDALDTARTFLSSRPPPDASPSCSVADVVEAAVATLRPLADAKEILLHVSVPGDLHAAVLAAELRSIVTNLVKNAIESLAPGGRIVIAASGCELHVSLTVVDDGPGIDDAKIASIFEPWMTTKALGTGLGLSMVRDLARARGGDVIVGRGEELRGASFTVRIPRAPAAPAGRSGYSAHTSAVHRRAPLLRSDARVLVVDDDEALRGMVSTALELRGATVTAVAGATEAAEVEGHFDLALVDLTLRDGRGDWLSKYLRENAIAERVVLMTGAVGAAFDPGAATIVLRKPFAIDELNDVVDRVAPLAPARAR